MKNFIISVDSSACFTKDELKKYGILMAHLTYTLDGIEYIDKFEKDDDKQAFYDKLTAGHLAQSSKVNPASFVTAWEESLQQGNDIIHLSLSSKVSGSFDSACQAAAELTKKYGRKIEVVDTKTGSFALTALALDVARMQETVTLEEAKNTVLGSLDEYNLIFTVGDIKHLYRGGRISHMKAIVGGLLHLKPMLYVSEEGKLTFLVNARGAKKAISILVKKMGKSLTDLSNYAFIAHGGDISFAQALKKKLYEAFPKLKDIKVDYLTPVLGLHAGPGALVLCFRGARRNLVIEETPIKEILDKIHLSKHE